MKITMHLPYELTREELQGAAQEAAVRAILARQTYKLAVVTAKALEKGSREPIEAKATF